MALPLFNLTLWVVGSSSPARAPWLTHYQLLHRLWAHQDDTYERYRQDPCPDGRDRP